MKEYLPRVSLFETIEPQPVKVKKEDCIIKHKESGELCPKCYKSMERRGWKYGYNHDPNKKYYFTQWDVCTTCKHVQHYEKFKVYQ